MINVATSGAVTNDGAAIVYGQPPRTGPAKRAKVNHLSVAQPKSVGRTVAARVSLAGDLVLVIDRISNTPTAAECTERSHSAVLVDKPEEVAGGIVGITNNHSQIVDAVSGAGIAAKCPEIGHLPVCVKKSVVLTADCIGIANDLTRVIQIIGDTVISTERPQIDHLPSGVKEGTIGAVRESRITGDVTRRVDSASVAIFAAQATDVDELAVAIEKCGIGRVAGGGARFSRHLSAGVDALATTITAEAIRAQGPEIGNGIGLSGAGRCEQSERSKNRKLAEVTTVVNG